EVARRLPHRARASVQRRAHQRQSLQGLARIMRGAAGEVFSCRRAPRRVFLLLALALGAAIQLACAASEPGAAASTTTPTRVVRGERLTVEIMDPNHPERYHR